MTQVDDEKEEPLDPAVEHIRQRMMRMLKVNGIIMIGLMAVLVAIVYKINREKGNENVDDQASVARSVIPGGDNNAQSGVNTDRSLLSQVDVDIPDGARFISSDLVENHLVINLILADQVRQIWIVDLQSGNVISRVSIK